MQMLEYLCPSDHVIRIAQNPWAPPKRIWECKQCQARVRVHLRDAARKAKSAN